MLVELEVIDVVSCECERLATEEGEEARVLGVGKVENEGAYLAGV
jgi:hypothetical protein